MNPTVLGFKPPHDGSITLIKDNELKFSLEGEKDSNQRYSPVYLQTMLSALETVKDMPDIIAFGDDYVNNTKGFKSGYYGTDSSVKIIEDISFFGKKLKAFHSTHERAHLFCSYGLSPFPQGEPYYALCLEGSIGRFYYISPEMEIKAYEPVMYGAGMRYIFPYYIADPVVKEPYKVWDFGMAGKMMALTGFGRKENTVRLRWKAAIDRMLDCKIGDDEYRHYYIPIVSYFRRFPINRIGVESQHFKDFSYHYSEAIFDRFYRFAEANLKEKYPLLISGGCGLNCSWNTKWKDSGLFSDVFVPPCTSDSGSGIGYAIDALHHFTGNAKIKWSVYAGEDFVNDFTPGGEFAKKSLEYAELSDLLAQGLVFAWVQGRYEIGPRALSNRSLIAAPFMASMKQRLNHIKQREDFRPIAPVCTEESVSRFFNWEGESPYMLHFMEVKDPNLQAVTHADNSARAQTVRRDQNPAMYDLLKKFEEKTGYPVLCNTSLNYKEKGFINRMSDLTDYVLKNDVDGMAVGSLLYIKKNKLKT